MNVEKKSARNGEDEDNVPLVRHVNFDVNVNPSSLVNGYFILTLVIVGLRVQPLCTTADTYTMIGYSRMLIFRAQFSG